MAFTEEQIKAIEFFDGPAMVLGTPGSGKTTVIINRVNNLIYEYNVKPENILVITFTRAAAESMEERFLELTGLQETKVRFGTFHSFFYWVVRTAYGSSAQLSVLDENKKRTVIKDILKSLNTEEYNSDETIRGILSDLGNMACNMIDIEYYHSKNMSDELFYRIYHEYEEYKKKNGFLDFDDMVSQCYNLLKDRQDILEAIRNLYPYILVDEYQVTNRVQYEILKLLAHPRDNLYVVGDDDQSIYGFRGARPDIMKLFEKEFPGAKIIGLSYNFRCPEEIVDFSTKIISKNEGRFEKTLKSNVSKKGTVSICKVPDIKSENTELVKKIKTNIPNVCLTTDIIVGFPGETESEFADTLEVVEEVKYDSAFTFIYSPRVGTPAALMKDNVTLKEKEDRLQRLNTIVNKYALINNQKYQDKVVEVLVLGESEKDHDKVYGYTNTMKLVNVNAPKDVIGKIINVKITDCKSFSLDGVIIDK